jgi:6-phospho-beta-glucosidase
MELNGKDVLPSLLMEEDFLTSSHLNIFERELINNIGMWINEYLYYYYYREKALESILSEKSTRGEEILELNRQLFEQMEDIGIAHNPVKALSTYYHYQQRRNSTYMHYARPNTPNKIEADSIFDSLPFNSNFQDEGEGYAGVALDIIQAFETESQIITALNVPNEGSIPCMDKDDVVEVSCRVSGKMIRPLPIGKIPEHQELLMRSVKSYEKLTVQAILSGSRQKAVMAMMAHPLVMSYSLASILVDEYLSAHKEFIGNWK